MNAKVVRTLLAATLVSLAPQIWSSTAQAQTWTKLTHAPSFDAGTALLLTDGRVLVQDANASTAGRYFTLTPDNTGSYVNGTWTQVASLPSGYGPLYYASAVLPDARVIVMGGEYNFGSAVWTTLGAIYDPVANAWTHVAAPAGWTQIGDAESVVLANGTFMMVDCCTTQQATLNPTTLGWTSVGTGKADIFDEEGFTLLPSGAVLVVDANNTTNPKNSELYLPKQGKWISAGNTPVSLVDPSSHELGPGVLRPDGTVFYVGATGNTAIYTPSATGIGSWATGPKFPNVGGQLDEADGPAAVLPDGNVLLQASPGVFNLGSHFYEFNGTTLTAVPATTTAAADPSYVGRMLVLPTGQIFWTDGSTNVEVYNSTGTYNPAWAPAILAAPTSVTRGSTYKVAGTLFNGMTQGGFYGDDAQMATNYPLVQIVNVATGHVFFARTHDHSAMAVAYTKEVVTQFDVPAGAETGASQLIVVTNGIPSAPSAITVN